MGNQNYMEDEIRDSEVFEDEDLLRSLVEDRLVDPIIPIIDDEQFL